MTAPFCLLTLFLTSGIALFSFMRLPQPVFWSVFCVLLLSAWMAYYLKKYLFSLAAVLLTLMFFGGFYASFVDQKYESNPLRNIPPGSTVEVAGRLSQSPSRGIDRDYLLLAVDKIRTQNQEQRWRGLIRISVLKTPEILSLRNLLVGDELEITGQFGSLEGFRNFSPDPGSKWMKYSGIHQTLFAKSPLLVQRISGPPGFNPGRLISRLRQSMQDKIESFFSDKDGGLSPSGAVLEALMLGERGRLPDSITRALQKSGIFHLFAISGAHIGIISFFLFAFLGLLSIPKRIRYGLLIPALLLFALLVEGRPSVFRATLMTLAFLVGKLFWKDTDLLNVLAASAFILLLLNPLDLFSVGFQLTYSATLSIILFFPKISNYLPKLPFRISEILAISITAQFGVFPIIAAVFNRVTFSSLILNFAALPMIALLMACGFLFLLFSFLFAPAAQIVAVLIGLISTLVISLSHLFDGISFLSYRIPTPPPWAVAGYYFSLVAFLFPMKKKTFGLLKWPLFLFFFFVIAFHPYKSSNTELKLTFIDVGQGEATLIEFPGRETMLVDGGGFAQSRFDVGESVVSPFLWRKGLKSIDILALTHAHPDHILGLISVAENFKIKEFWDSLPPKDCVEYDRLKQALLPDTICKQRLHGYQTNIGGVHIEVLHPFMGKDPSPQVHNDLSMVMKLSYGRTSILLTGDIGSKVENTFLSQGMDIDIDVLKVAHHGSRTSSSESFLIEASPQICVISSGRRNIFGLPDQVVIDRLLACGSRIYRTDENGAVEIVSNGRDIKVRTAAPKKSSTLSPQPPGMKSNGKLTTLSLERTI